MNLNLHQVKQKASLTEANLSSALFRLSWPAMVGMLFQSLTGITDVYFLGRLGDPSAQAAIGIFAVLQGYLGSYNSIIGNGSISVISQLYGSGKRKEAGKATTQTLALKLFGSMIFTLPVFFFLKPLLILLGATGNALTLGMQYGKVLCLMIPFMNTNYTFNTALRAAGDAITPMYLMLGSLILNLILNVFFILGIPPFPKLGILGVAYATTIAQLALFTGGLFYYSSSKSLIRIDLKEFFHPDLKQMGKIFSIGLPTGFQGLIGSFGSSLIMRSIAGFGMQTVAAYTVATRVAGFAGMPIGGLTFATSAIVGQNVGAKKSERAIKATNLAAIMAVSITLIFFLLLLINPIFFLHIFSKDPSVDQLGVTVLFIFSFLQITGALASIYSAPLLGTGYLKIGFYLSLFVTWVIQIPSMYLLSHYFGMNGLWASFILANFVNLYLIFRVFKKRNWLFHVI